MNSEPPTDMQAEKILRRISRLLAPITNSQNRATAANRETAKERYWRRRCERLEAKLTEAGVLWRGGRRTRSKNHASDDRD